MKRLMFVGFLWMCLILTVHAAMSDSKAMSEAKKLWGNQATIAQERSFTDSNWNRYIGIKSPQCISSMLRLGSGFNTWDAAFAEYEANKDSRKPFGPLKGTVELQIDIYDNKSVVSAEIFIDGTRFASKTFEQSPDYYYAQGEIKMTLDTNLLSPGYHVICAKGKDAAGNEGAAPGVLFLVDQTASVAIPVWDVDGPLFLAGMSPEFNQCVPLPDDHLAGTPHVCSKPDNRAPQPGKPYVPKPLTALSPAVGKALCLPEVPFDIVGRSRPSRPKDWLFPGDTGCDIGAYQYASHTQIIPR